jgi:GH24 family phage-related lysozyme (muramidase)
LDIRQSAVDRTAGFEAFVGYLYLDSKGNVTAGYGHKLADANSAVGVHLKKNGKEATDKVKRDEWTTMKSQAVGHPASYYEQFTTLTFGETDAKSLLRTDLEGAASDLEVRFPSLDDYPDAAQDALLDMMFNIGLTRFTSAKWPGLFKAVQKKDWKTAAAESHRADVPDDRNDAIRDLFLSASRSARTQMLALRSLFDSQLVKLSDFLRLGQESDKFFPNGITKIHLSVKAASVELSLEIDGPDHRAGSGARIGYLTSTADKIIATCEDKWDANKSDCNAFVKAVATEYGITLAGVADDIVDTIKGSGWEQLSDGIAAKAAADDGKLVIGGLKGADHDPPRDHGHVVIVVSGPLANGKYPTGYWGSLGGVGKKNTTINYAWVAADRDNVVYAAKTV